MGLLNTLQEDEMSMGLGARAVWDSLFVAMIAVAIVGNLIVLWIILGRYRRRGKFADLVLRA